MEKILHKVLRKKIQLKADKVCLLLRQHNQAVGVLQLAFV